MNIVVKMLVYLLSIFGLAADITVLNRNEQQTIQKFEHCSYGLVTVFFLAKDRRKIQAKMSENKIISIKSPSSL